MGQSRYEGIEKVNDLSDLANSYKAKCEPSLKND